MKVHAEESIPNEDIPKDNQDISSPNNAPIENKNYGKKFSARVYKFFSLFMFFIYYLNCMWRIVSNCVKYFKEQGVKTFTDWLTLTLDSSKWGEICDAIFDWYTITLLVFLALYFIVFMVTFIRYSPRNKKTFKFFKKGFVMARRLIKLISVGLTLTVLVNSAQLASFSDKFLFVISLFAIIFTFMQICISVTVWIWGRKLNRSVKHYVGNVMSSYMAATRVRPDTEGKRKTVGDKLGKAKDRFLHTIEAMTFTREEAMQKDAEYDGYIIENNDMTERFENDYLDVSVDETPKDEKGKKYKKSKSAAKKVKKVSTKKTPSTKVSTKKVKTDKNSKDKNEPTT